MHKLSLGEGDSIWTNEGPVYFPMGDDNEMAKINWQHFKISSQEPTGQFQPNLAQSILGWRGSMFVQMKAISERRW